MKTRADLLTHFLRLSPDERSREYLAVKQTAARLGKHPSAVRRLIDEDKIPAIKVYGTIYIHWPTLEERLMAAQNS